MRPMIVVLAVGVAGVLAGCAVTKQSSGTLPFDPARPQVYVTQSGLIVLDQEPVVIPQGAKELKITWQLRAEGARFAPETGITIDRLDKLLQADGNPLKLRSKVELDRKVADEDNALRKRAASSRSLFPCSGGPTEFTCTINTEGLPRGLYAYTVRLIVNGKEVELDPRMLF